MSKRVWDRGYFLGIRRAIFAALGDRCSTCDALDRRILEVHHKHGGGTAHRRRGRGVAYYLSILRDLRAYELQCANCHARLTYRRRK